MSRIGLIVLALGLAAAAPGCQKEVAPGGELPTKVQDGDWIQPVGAESSEPMGARPADEGNLPPPAAEGAPLRPPDAAPIVEDCFDACMRARQMQATGIEVIQRECRRDCGVPEPTAPQR